MSCSRQVNSLSGRESIEALWNPSFMSHSVADYGSKPAVILPIADADNVNGKTNTFCDARQSDCTLSKHPRAGAEAALVPSPSSSSSSSEAVMIDSIKWRDLGFKSASIGCTVLVDR